MASDKGEGAQGLGRFFGLLRPIFLLHLVLCHLSVPLRESLSLFQIRTPPADGRT